MWSANICVGEDVVSLVLLTISAPLPPLWTHCQIRHTTMPLLATNTHFPIGHHHAHWMATRMDGECVIINRLHGSHVSLPRYQNNINLLWLQEYQLTVIEAINWFWLHDINWQVLQIEELWIRRAKELLELTRLWHYSMPYCSTMNFLLIYVAPQDQWQKE